MDFAIDFFTENNSDRIVEYPEFIYDNRRFFAKLSVFLKLFGTIFYTITLTRCSKTELYIIMIIILFLSTVNSIRYEYKHFQRYGTIFSSINEFEIWKKNLYPNSRVVFSVTELIIKIVIFIKIFPPQFELTNLCDIGESVLKIHILVLLLIYILCGIFSICIFSSFYCLDDLSYQNPSRRQGQNSIPIPISIPISILVIDNQNNECCICLDTNIQMWTILPCGHKFHSSCISTWLLTKQSCPICRHDVNCL